MRKRNGLLVVGFATAAVAGLAIVVWWAVPLHHEDHKSHDEASTVATTTATTTTTPHTSSTHVAASPPSARSAPIIPDPIAEAFGGEDDAKKIDAVEDAVRDGTMTALPKLAAIDLKSEPEAAPTIIHGVANLAAQGDRSDRGLAVRTLSRWLRDESDRLDTHLDRDAAGNVPNIIDALGEVGGRDAVDTLVAALDTGKLDLSVQTLTVQKLSELGDPRATASIERFAERVTTTRPTASDDFERELHDEASAEARTAIARLRPR